jgi:hypothetical protein
MTAIAGPTGQQEDAERDWNSAAPVAELLHENGNARHPNQDLLMRSAGMRAGITFALFCGAWASFSPASGFARAADWLSPRADGQRTGWQPKERQVNPKTVKGLRLLWKRRLDEGTISSPVLLGPVITHRGIKELVFVTSASGHVIAVDADLGTVFWSRQLPFQAPGGEGKALCPSAPPMPPVILSSTVAALPDEAANPSAAEALAINDDDDFSDGNQTLLVLTLDGRLHGLKVISGDDASPAQAFTDPGPQFATGFGTALYAGTSKDCSELPTKLSALRVEATGITGAKPEETAPAEGSGFNGLAIGLKDTLYASVGTNSKAKDMALALDAETLRLKDGLQIPAGVRGEARGDEFLDSSMTVFPWHDSEVTALVGPSGQLVLWTHGKPAPSETEFFGGRRGGDKAEKWFATGGLTTWTDTSRERWVAAIAVDDPGSDTGSRRVLGFRVVEKNSHASLELAWRSDVFTRPTAPVVAAGVLYLISQNGKGPALLTALEAKTGAMLFSTSEGIESKSVAAALAFANGHLCFSGNDGLLYCFGLPIDI